jgi:CheY-like chemotaxis protein
MMLSSSGQHGESARCRELGVAAYLTKPIQAHDLYEAICAVLNRTAKVRPAAPVAPVAAPRGPRGPLRILLAEDNIVNQRVAVGLLARRGHAVTVTNNGVEALAALEREAFDVVLMDLQMPEMGGFEATAAIRAREREQGGHLRIIAMTAHAMTGDREHCLEAGMDGYLSKPIDPNMLYATLEHESSAVVPVPAQPGRPASAPPIDRALLLQRLGDEQLAAEILGVFLGDCPQRLIAIKAAVDARDAERIRMSTHALKGAAGNIAATRLFDAARTLERLGAENRLEAAVAAWRQLSIEAAQVLDAIRQLEPAGTHEGVA